jgi:hypothetical protein
VKKRLSGAGERAVKTKIETAA